MKIEKFKDLIAMTSFAKWFLEKESDNEWSYKVFQENDIHLPDGTTARGHPLQLFTITNGDGNFEHYRNLIEAIPQLLNKLYEYQEILLRVKGILGPSVPSCLTKEVSCEGCASEWSEALRVLTDALEEKSDSDDNWNSIVNLFYESLELYPYEWPEVDMNEVEKGEEEIKNGDVVDLEDWIKGLSNGY